jgi:hypothetical protein
MILVRIPGYRLNQSDRFFASIAGCEQNLIRCEQKTNLVAHDTFCILHSQGFFLQHWPDWSVACFDREPCAAHNTVRDATLIAANPTSPNAITRNDFPELLAM